MYPYGLIGNCQLSALVSASGSIDWLCLPRPDSPPVFGSLLDSEGGLFSIKHGNDAPSSEKQYYRENTNILVTEISDEKGNQFQITDFCPRFEQYGRLFRPLCLIRMVTPLKGTPEIRVKISPIDGWTKQRVQPIQQSNHLRYEIRGEALRLLTNVPLTYILESSSFRLTAPAYFILSWGFAIEDDIKTVAEEFLLKTDDYWQSWVKHCSIPVLYQKEVIRSALALKLHCYEDTGAILAALTTSLPEEPCSVRNWDYRFCWLRDSYFLLSAFHYLGHFEEMEAFLGFLTNIASRANTMRPVYRIDQTIPDDEIILENWSGFNQCKPVHINNQAANQIQNDVYGEMILALTPLFLDHRFHSLKSTGLESLMTNLANHCARVIHEIDAGIWEYRLRQEKSLFSQLMSWAGLERIRRIQKKGNLREIDLDIGSLQDLLVKEITESAEKELLAFESGTGKLDAAWTQLPILHFPNTKLNEKLITAIHSSLGFGGERPLSSYIYRYRMVDDFGTPDSAFVSCSFWLAQAYASLHRKHIAKQILDDTKDSANNLGLIAEHYHPLLKQQRGNFPQAYSHASFINAAFAVSPPWSEVL
jgi:GH15 family glucan-1,4-alpha-glucosidase